MCYGHHYVIGLISYYFIFSFEVIVDASAATTALEILEENIYLPSTRNKRQSNELCDFGVEPSLVSCDWNNRNGSISKWTLGAGVLSNWLGGPNKDASTGEDSERGGYMFFETSSMSVPLLRVNETPVRDAHLAFMDSPQMKTTGPEGKCVSFSYAIDGLSAAGLRVVMQPVGTNGWPDGYSRVLYETKDPTNKVWITGQTVYTYNKEHQIVFEGVAKEFLDPFRKFRGYVAVDNVAVKSGSECKGHCTFEGGFCGWNNEDDDDFNWSLGRGSRNPSTGPTTDRYSFIHGGMEGGYAYIDSSYPRRPGDVAKLSSPEFDATGADTPQCMRLFTHMFGNGIGSLTISISDTRENQQRDIWTLSGEAGNAWYIAEMPIANPNPFKVIISARVGKNNLGDIAIDDISITPGPCPTAPQIAAPQSGDCTFEVDECGWTNVGLRERVDDIDWERTSGAALRSILHDHTLRSERGYLVALTRNVLQKPGSRGWFTSRDLRILNPSSQNSNPIPKCISFWFIMNEAFIDVTGPSLGALTLYTRSNERDSVGNVIMKPIWRLYNHQGPDWQYAQASISDSNDLVIIEGIWGSSRAGGFIAFDDVTFFSGSCTTLPKGAKVRPGECRFERDMCDWTNLTDKSMAAWRLATVNRRPANLPDKTFGAPEGYIYYDLFNQILGSNMVRLVSPTITAVEEPQLCFSFWYAAFGAGDSALMQIIKQDTNSSDDASAVKIWSLEAKSMDTTRPTWQPAQVTVDSNRDFHLVLEGQATNGGFAIDDLTFTPGSCPTRPEKAIIKDQSKS